MHKNLDQIKKLEGSPKVVKNLFNKEELDKFLIYTKIFQQQYNKKQNVIKKRWLKNYSEELETLFYKKLRMKSVNLEWIILKMKITRIS